MIKSVFSIAALAASFVSVASNAQSLEPYWENNTWTVSEAKDILGCSVEGVSRFADGRTTGPAKISFSEVSGTLNLTLGTANSPSTTNSAPPVSIKFMDENNTLIGNVSSENTSITRLDNKAALSSDYLYDDAYSVMDLFVQSSSFSLVGPGGAVLATYGAHDIIRPIQMMKQCAGAMERKLSKAAR